MSVLSEKKTPWQIWRCYANYVLEYLHSVVMNSIFIPAHASVMVLCCACKACSNQRDIVFHFNKEWGVTVHTETVDGFFFFFFFFLPLHVSRGDPKLNCKIIRRWELTGCVSTARCRAEGVYHLNLGIPGLLPNRGRRKWWFKHFQKKIFDVQRCSTWKEVWIYIYTGLHAPYC